MNNLDNPFNRGNATGFTDIIFLKQIAYEIFGNNRKPEPAEALSILLNKEGLNISEQVDAAAKEVCVKFEPPQEAWTRGPLSEMMEKSR